VGREVVKKFDVGNKSGPGKDPFKKVVTQDHVFPNFSS
jgi:hypothetical protein